MNNKEKDKLYTIRWYNKKIEERGATFEIKDLARSQLLEINHLLEGGEGAGGPVVTIPDEEPERPNPTDEGKKLLYYPKAIVTSEKMPTRGNYKDNYPVGAVVHFTAGRSLKGDSDALNTIRSGIANGYCYFCISNDGSVFQSFPLDKWGYHCGKSTWPTLGSGLSNKLVGIEICCAGKLDKNNTSWFGETYPANQTRMVGAHENQEAGNYHKYTPEQEASLIDLLLWLKKNNPDVFKIENVLGHDSVSPGRKNDPGGSLSMTMPEFVEKLKGLL